MVRKYQFGGLSADIGSHRKGNAASAPLLKLIDLCSVKIDVPRLVIYRGLVQIDPPVELPIVWHEHSVSAWTVYPSIALRIALAFGTGPVVLLAQDITCEAYGLYIDDWEHEVLCPPHSFEIGESVSQTMNFLADNIHVTMLQAQRLE